MPSEPDADVLPSCGTCGTELSNMSDDPDTDEVPEGQTLLYCLECQRGVCPFCGRTAKCSHFVGFNRSGDFGYSSLEEWLPRFSESGAYFLEVLGIEEDWPLLDRLIEESPHAITTIEFHAVMHFNRYHYAINGEVVREALASEARREYDEAVKRNSEEDE